MNYNEIMTAAKDQIGPYCKACPVCNGRACGNAMPGPGCKYPGNTAARNFDKWQEICVNMDTLCPNADPDVSFEMFGVKFSAPIFAAPLGAIDLHYGPKYKDPEYNSILIKACADYGLMALTGDGVDPNIMLRSAEDMKKVSGMGCPIIKPWNKEAVFEKLDVLNEAKIFCAGMDVDGAGLPFLKAMNPNAGSKSVDEMREIIEYANMPFIVKGIMTAKGAVKAVEAGAAAIVVSNHGGRVQGGVPSTAEVLPEIVEAVNNCFVEVDTKHGTRLLKRTCTILVDGGIRSGVDVFRALALGADGVLIGRPILPMIYAAGEEGFKVYMDKIIGELKSTMTMCGAATLKDITRDKVRF